MDLILHSFYRSAYGRIAEIVLAEKELSFVRKEINPFAEDLNKEYLKLHPFARVPVLQHGSLTLYETNVITEYLDDCFSNSALRPVGPESRAKMRQIVAVIDNYGYWPMVRQVFSERISRPSEGFLSNEEVVAEGLAESARTLAALEEIISEEEFLVGPAFSLADAHLIPMIDYFCMTTEGKQLLASYPKLSDWWASIEKRPCTINTRPDWPNV